MSKINIAIDGYSSCGKTTLAKAIAKSLQYIYMDTGAMYRAVTLFFLENDVELNDQESIILALENIDIRFNFNKNENKIFLNGKDITDQIRDSKVSSLVSEVSTISLVRRAMVREQQEIAMSKGVVMDGRDIGTVVLPNAELKYFLTAELDTRVERRWQELKIKGKEAILKDVKLNLLKRDHIDSTREDSPLKQAEDAVLIDNTLLTISDQLALINKDIQKILQ